jgi:ketosteroid isomerase-like protein
MKVTKLAVIGILMSFSNITNVAADELYATLDKGNQSFAKAILAKNVDNLVSNYTDDACVIAPHTTITCGREAIREFWTTVINSGPKDVSIVTQATGSSGDLAYATGTLAITEKNGTIQKNNYVLVLKFVADGWKLHLDTWTPQ